MSIIFGVLQTSKRQCVDHREMLELWRRRRNAAQSRRHRPSHESGSGGRGLPAPSHYDAFRARLPAGNRSRSATCSSSMGDSTITKIRRAVLDFDDILDLRLQSRTRRLFALGRGMFSPDGGRLGAGALVGV